MKYIFWEQYDCKKISGLPKLIQMGVKALSINHQVALISAPTSLVYLLLKEEKINFQFIPEETLGKNADISCEDIIILPNFGSKDLVLHKYNPKVIVWQIYVSMCLTSKLQKFVVRNQMRLALMNNAFVSMDRYCLDCVSKELNLDFPRTIIPMPIDHLNYRYTPSHLDDTNTIIKISYLGRAVPWKAFSLIKLLQDASRIRTRKFEIHVITDSAIKFSSLISRYLCENVDVIYHEGLYGEKMLDLMCQMNIHLAMGISTLEGAALGIPTLSAPYSNELIPEYYKFHWLYEDVDYYSCSPIDKEYVDRVGHSFEEIIYNISKYSYLKECSIKCYKSASLFSLKSVADKIEQIPTTLHLRNMHYLMGSYWRHKIRTCLH